MDAVSRLFFSHLKLLGVATKRFWLLLAIGLAIPFWHWWSRGAERPLYIAAMLVGLALFLVFWCFAIVALHVILHARKQGISWRNYLAMDRAQLDALHLSAISDKKVGN